MSPRRLAPAIAFVLAAAVLGAAGGATAAGAAAPAHTYPTTVAKVKVRSLPRRGSTVVKVLAAAGTTVTVSCYVTGQRIKRDSIWYRISSPATGYVAGYYVHSGHDPAAGVPHC